MLKELINQGMVVPYPIGYMVRQAMPYPLATSNSYLVEVDQGWTVIDVGVDLPATRVLWQKVIEALGITWAQIKAICITHCHPDHLGAAAWMQRMSDAPVYMFEDEIKRAQTFIFLPDEYAANYLQRTQSEMDLQGFDAHKQQQLVTDWQNSVRPLYPEPEWILPLGRDDVITLHGSPYQIVELPGHTDGQIGFWDQKGGTLFSADLVAVKGSYLHFTDWPNTHNDNSLGSMLAVLEKEEIRRATALFPGHGLLIEPPQPALERLKKRHQSQLQQVAEIISQPCSATELYQQMIKLPDEEYIHYHRVCLGEALGYMRYLEAVGQACSYHDKGVLKFQRV